MSARNFQLFGSAKRFGNITIQRGDDGRMISVLLHGNEVVTLDTFKGLVRLSNCGWVTPTTHTAINTALSQIEGFELSVGAGRKELRGQTVIYSHDQDNQVFKSRPLVNGEWFKYV